MQGEARLHFSANHPAFAGHFPGRPIVPGVLLLDAALHAAEQSLEGGGARPSGLCRISSAKFLSPVSPGETLTLTWSSTGTGQTRFDIACGERPVATGLFVFEAAA